MVCWLTRLTTTLVDALAAEPSIAQCPRRCASENVHGVLCCATLENPGRVFIIRHLVRKCSRRATCRTSRRTSIRWESTNISARPVPTASSAIGPQVPQSCGAMLQGRPEDCMFRPNRYRAPILVGDRQAPANTDRQRNFREPSCKNYEKTVGQDRVACLMPAAVRLD